MSRRRHTPEQIIRKLAEGQKLLAGDMTRRGGLPPVRYCRVDLGALVVPVRRHESRRRQTPQRTRGRKRSPEEAPRRSGAGESDLERGCVGKLLTPNRKRAAVVMAQTRFGVSERFACRTIGQHRSTQRLAPPVTRRRRRGDPRGAPEVLHRPATVGLATCRDPSAHQGPSDQQQAGAPSLA